MESADHTATGVLPGIIDSVLGREKEHEEWLKVFANIADAPQFSNIHQNRMNIGDFYGLASCNSFNCLA